MLKKVISVFVLAMAFNSSIAYAEDAHTYVLTNQSWDWTMVDVRIDRGSSCDSAPEYKSGEITKNDTWEIPTDNTKAVCWRVLKNPMRTGDGWAAWNRNQCIFQASCYSKF